MVELVLVLFALLALGTPAVSIVFALGAVGASAWRQKKLRRQVEELTELSVQQSDALRRELLELKRQVAESRAPSDSTVPPHFPAPPLFHPAIQVPSEKAVAPAAGPRPLPTIDKKPEITSERHEKNAMAPVSEKPVAPVPPSSDAAPQESKPAAPVLPTQRPEPARPAISVPPTPSTTVPRPTTPVPPITSTQPAARVAAPTQFAALHSPAPKKSVQERMKSVFALEETLGTNWLNKLGIIILVFGVALFGIYELGQVGPLGKVGLSFVVSLALLGGGIFLEKGERFRVLGHTLIGGGWALLFFTTYASNHVHAMRVLSSESVDLILMLGVALAMVAHTLRYRSQVVTGLAFLLAYSTVALSHDNVYSLSSGVILAVGLVGIVIKMGWFQLEIFGILSSYLNHAYWLYRMLGPGGAQGHAFPEYQASTAILLFYWLTYRVSYVVRKTKTPADEHFSSAAALLNTLLLLGAMKFQSVRPELAAMALGIIGAIEFTIGQFPLTKRRREAFVVLSVLGAALMVAAVPFHYSGNNVAILWLIGAETFLAAGVAVGEVVFRRLGLLTGLLVGLHLIRVDFPQLIAARSAGEDILLPAGVMFGLCAVALYLNEFFVGRRWGRFFRDSPDAQLLVAQSYVGGFAAASAAWALCSEDWTAVAFAGIMLSLALLGQKLQSWHLRVQYGLVGLLSLYRVVVFNLHSELPLHSHVLTRLITLPIVAAAFYLTARWTLIGDDANQRTLRELFAIAGTALVAVLIYYEVPELWQPFAAMAFAVLLLEVGRQIRHHALAWHAHVLSVLAVLAAVTADQAGLQRWHNIPLHAFAALPVVVGTYWMARRISAPIQAQIAVGRIAYSWMGTGVMVWVLNEASPAPWIAVSWIIFAIALALAMRRIGDRQLAWQANAVAVCALLRACTFNLSLEQSLWYGVSLRLLTISMVAAGLYFLSRKAIAPGVQSVRAISYLHTSAATALLALLAWQEAPDAWLAPLWATFALMLALVDRRFELEDLAWQAHALAVLTMLRGITVNLHETAVWRGMSIRLLSLGIVVLMFYALSRIVRIPGEWRARELHHIYSWAASVLVSLLMWYELQPLSVAVGWAVFGLVLFEYGLLRHIRQFRLQAYVALVASFSRIFFANLMAGNPGEFWGPRMYTVLPIALVLFFVYAQLGPDDLSAKEDRRFYLDVVIAYLGTGTVVALLYFQFASDWLVTAWAVVVFGLLGMTLMLDRPIFLHQGLLLTLGICARGVTHNLFGASYFSGGDWTGRYFVLGSAIAILLACLPFAFRLRSRYKARVFANRWIRVLMRHPEQFMFFAPVLLLTLMLALKMRAGMVTVAWGIEGVLIVLLALAAGERSYRLTGLGLLLLCVGKVMARDAWGLAPRDRYLTFIILGTALLLVSFLYSKYRDAIRQFL